MAQVFANPNNVTTFIKQLQYFNSLTDVGSGGLIGTLLLFAIFGVLFMIQKAFSFEKAFIVSALITSFFAIMFRILGLVNDFALYLGVIGIVISLWMLFHESPEM